MDAKGRSILLGVGAAAAVGSGLYYLFGKRKPKKRTKKILGVGNPLLDISAVVEQNVLDKYGLLMGNAILAGDAHLPLYAEMCSNYPVEYIAGGATCNSIRVAQWMLQEPGCTFFVGAVGQDRYSEQLAACIAKDGVQAAFNVLPDQPTGTCACLIKGKERSLVANLSAAGKFQPEHLSTPEVQRIRNSVDIVYSAGFFITTSVPAYMKLAQDCLASGKIFCTNISAPFIAQFFNEPLTNALPYVDFIFGNESEAEALADALKFENRTPVFVARSLAAWPKKNNTPRVAVITQGPKGVIVATTVNNEIQITEYPVPPLAPALIVDANGAGDGFVGGFLSQLARDQPLSVCVAAGCYAAQKILQVSGTQLSGRPSFRG